MLSDEEEVDLQPQASINMSYFLRVKRWRSTYHEAERGSDTYLEQKERPVQK
jgi:hypothetical protein